MQTEPTRLSAYKANIIEGLFVNTADEAYVAARWAYLNQLHLLFFWNAVHALEKYMKAVLLFNDASSICDQSGKFYHHNVIVLLESVKQIGGNLLPDILEVPKEIGTVSSPSESLEVFIRRLYKYGDPNNRYDFYGFAVQEADIFKLDQTVFAIKRLCCPLNAYYFSEDQGRRGLPDYLWRDVLNRSDADSWVCRTTSNLRRLADDGSADLKRAIYELNFQFAPIDYRHSKTEFYSASTTSALLRRIFLPFKSGSQEQLDDARILARWVLDKIKVGREDRRDLEKIIKSLP